MIRWRLTAKGYLQRNALIVGALWLRQNIVLRYSPEALLPVCPTVVVLSATQMTALFAVSFLVNIIATGSHLYNCRDLEYTIQAFPYRGLTCRDSIALNVVRKASLLIASINCARSLLIARISPWYKQICKCSRLGRMLLSCRISPVIILNLASPHLATQHDYAAYLYVDSPICRASFCSELRFLSSITSPPMAKVVGRTPIVSFNFVRNPSIPEPAS